MFKSLRGGGRQAGSRESLSPQPDTTALERAEGRKWGDLSVGVRERDTDRERERERERERGNKKLARPGVL